MQRKDEAIKKDVVDQLFWDGRVDAADIHVDVLEGRVTLSGEVPTFTARKAAELDAALVAGVKAVDDRLTVQTAATPFGIGELATHLENLLEWNSSIDTSGLTIAVEGGRVRLEGTVDALWKKHHAENLVSAVAGVTEVVNRLVAVPTAREKPAGAGEGNPDEAVARDIAAALERNARVNETRVDVKVENGVVTVSGVVPDRMSHDAVEEAARITHGVRDVVDRITIGEL
jgi:osmotically-inducible protein OsmY